MKNKILVVDDVPGWIRFHINNLKSLRIKDLTIDTAENANLALNKIETELDAPYDIIFTDLQMESNYLPKLAGEWLIEQIQMFKEYKNTKIIIVSASPSINKIAEKYNVLYIPKYEIRNADSETYRKFLLSD